MNPFVRLLCLLQLANFILLCLRAYTYSVGDARLDFVFISGILLILFIAWGLIEVQRMAKRRIEAIASAADNIIRTGDLSQRIADPYAAGEGRSLITVLNHMLTDIEQNMQATRTVSDNIAHDLRHPLTHLRNHIESLRDGETNAVKQERLTGLMAECDGMLATFQAMLRISNIENTRRHSGFREVSLPALMRDVIELYEPLAGEKHITLAVDEHPASIVGDKDLLFQALANLLDNAIKYTPDNGSISIRVGPTEKGGSICIADSGSGIPDEHKANVFRRFYRTETSRTQPGSGLGLSLVSAIIRLHKGRIELSDNQPRGLIVTVLL